MFAEFLQGLLWCDQLYRTDLRPCGKVVRQSPGGIDVDFVCRASPEEVYQRAKAMLVRSATRGGYALGTGNSVPDYVPDENYFAMIRAAFESR